MILPKHTQSLYDAVVSSPPQALLITGSDGSGKRFLASNLARDILEVSEKSLANHPYYLHIEPTKNTISIADVRAITAHLQLKTLGKQPIRRVVSIIDVHAMTIEAQNALLKTLEEPPSDTMIILTTHNHTALLSTIRSRVTELAVPPFSYEQAVQLAGKEDVGLRSLHALSEGNAGTLYALLHQSDHPQTTAIATAKRLISGNILTRLAEVNTITSKKDEASVVKAIIIIAKAGRDSTSLKGQVAAAKRWNNIIKSALVAQQQLAQNSQAKLALTNLFITM